MTLPHTQVRTLLLVINEPKVKENGYSDSLYFGANYISRRNTEYAMSLDNNNAILDYKRNINGFNITVGSNYTLMSAIPDYAANIEISNKF